MGNCLGRKQVVHPLEHSTSDYKLRIKVRMSARQLKEFMSRVDLRKGDSELGRVVLQECLDGRLTARVVGRQDSVLASEYANGLATIKEE
ncbi:conserved hypothetical protein [Ricinus communis]|uniref:Uncharacterized protein n=1 Tax=Ricinus communis TaxID=3988 RepID=B9RNJ7_RICCO|nr:conserved hypothetical protein [Ricinus communis]